MIEAHNFIKAMSSRGFGLYTGVPCSYLQPFINFVIGTPHLRYVAAANEGHAVAIASGAHLGGLNSVVMIQNSGLGNAVSPLTSLNHIFKLPVLLIVTLRGDPQGADDEPQHTLMGCITPDLLRLMEVNWTWFPQCQADIEPVIEQALEVMARRQPFCLIMRQGSVAPYQLRHVNSPQLMQFEFRPAGPTTSRPMRRDVLAALQAKCKNDALIATTGYTGRELYGLADRPNQFYMVGSMGLASSFGLGLAIAQPQRRIIVVDGDGAALMHLGALSSIGQQKPDNFVHLMLDNESYESTGGQVTAALSVDLAGVAHACGYATVLQVDSVASLDNALSSTGAGPMFIHIKIASGTTAALPRPDIMPVALASRFKSWLNE